MTHRPLADDEESQAWSDSQSDGEPQIGWGLNGPRGLVLAAIGAGLVAVALFTLHGSRHNDLAHPASARATQTVDEGMPELTQAPPVLPVVHHIQDVPQVPSSPAMIVPTVPTVPTVPAAIEPLLPNGERISTSKEAELPTTTTTRTLPTTPPAPHCNDNEELLAGLCYRKCSLLTDGEFPQRWAPNACHRDATEGKPAETKFKGILCNGFDVGDDAGCPHPPVIGYCDSNEELHAGMCYKKCELLTDGNFKVRSGANTCCEEWPCLDPSEDNIEGLGCHGFGVGGGLNGHNCPHPPE